jgi:hypothetical protein
MVLSGVQGVNSVINGLYLPTQETGQDGRRLYRKSGESGDKALCIEHVAGEWQAKNEMDRGSRRCRAWVRGNCALEDCASRPWAVYGGKKKWVDQPNVNVVTAAAILKDDSKDCIMVLSGVQGVTSFINGYMCPLKRQGRMGADCTG